MKRQSREKIEAILARIASVDRYTEFTKLYPHSARIEADSADSRKQAGFEKGYLDGAIVSVKDLFDICGETTTAGSALLNDRPAATADADVVRRLRNAGAIVIGKTNMSEFAFSGVGINSTFGTPGNALDFERIPGGSSSGAAVSVATATSEMSVGTDTGGTCRIPAALNGCVGFKPSHGSISTVGAFPLAPSLDTIGPIAMTVKDCARLYSVLSGRHLKPGILETRRKIRIAVGRGKFLSDANSRMESVFERAIGRISLQGAELVDIDIDHLWSKMLAAFPVPLVTVEAHAIHQKDFTSRPSAFDRRVSERIRMGADCSASDYSQGLQCRQLLIKQMAGKLEGFDALMTPTVPIFAPLTAELERDDPKFHIVNRLLLRNTSFGNLFDLCAISLPIIEGNLGAGIMLHSLKGGDQILLNTASIIETWL